RSALKRTPFVGGALLSSIHMINGPYNSLSLASGSTYLTSLTSDMTASLWIACNNLCRKVYTPILRNVKKEIQRNDISDIKGPPKLSSVNAATSKRPLSVRHASTQIRKLL